MGILAAVLILAFLIFFHELGHFLFAKLFGVKVIRFSIGFGKVLLSKKIGDTEYALSAIPFGGYVQMGGEDPSVLQSAEGEAKAGESFVEKPVWKRWIIAFVGPGFNFLLAFLVVAIIGLFYGVEMPTNIVGKVAEDSPAADADVKPGDEILRICKDETMADCTETPKWQDIQSIMSRSVADTPQYLFVKRGCEAKELCPAAHLLKVIPKNIKDINVFGESVEVVRVGILPHYILERGLAVAATGAFQWVWSYSKLIILSLHKILTGAISTKELGGPIAIVRETGRAADQGGIAGLLLFAAFLSLNLGIFNLFPIPVLDGGHIWIFLLFEAIRGRPMSARSAGIVQNLGLMFIISLMLFAVWNDIVRLVAG